MNRQINICIVEDCFIQSVVLRKILESEGFIITDVYRSGEEVVENLNNNQADIFLMDINLKGEMNGFDVANYIRKKSDLPILFVSGFRSEEITHQAANITNSSVEIKPIFRETFIESLNSLIKTDDFQLV